VIDEGRVEMSRRSITSWIAPLLALAWLSVPGEALGDEAAPAADRPAAATSSLDAYLKRHPFFFGAWGGFSAGLVRHPELQTRRLLGPMLSLGAGYTISTRWVASIEFTSFVVPVERVSGTDQFASASSWLRTQIKCSNCRSPVGGGYVSSTALVLSTVGPRVEVSPFGRDGLYLGASGGVAIVSGLGGPHVDTGRVGGTGTGRLGFRLRPTHGVSLALEAGAQGHGYGGASAVLFFGALQGRLHM
jgi:hypothetical protein